MYSLYSLITKIQAHHHLKYHERNVNSMTLHHTLLLLTRRNTKVGLLGFLFCFEIISNYSRNYYQTLYILK